MASSRELFVNPEQIKACANRINALSNRMNNTLRELIARMKSTEAIYQAQSATAMREKFEETKPILDEFDDYLRTIAAFLINNVADTATVVDQAAVQRVAAIHKPH